MMIVGQRLKELRKSKGLTPKQLASQMEVSVFSILAYELGINSLTPKMVEKYCSLFNVSVGYVLGLEKYDIYSSGVHITNGCDTPEMERIILRVIETLNEAEKARTAEIERAIAVGLECLEDAERDRNKS